MKLTTSPIQRISETHRRQVLARVRAALEPHQARDYRLVVDPRGLEMRGDEWLVVVRPDQDGAPLGDCVTRMMAAEDDLRRRWRMNISLLPTMPPEDD
jgi:hypothetical protein